MSSTTSSSSNTPSVLFKSFKELIEWSDNKSNTLTEESTKIALSAIKNFQKECVQTTETLSSSLDILNKLSPFVNNLNNQKITTLFN